MCSYQQQDCWSSGHPHLVAPIGEHPQQDATLDLPTFLARLFEVPCQRDGIVQATPEYIWVVLLDLPENGVHGDALTQARRPQVPAMAVAMEPHAVMQWLPVVWVQDALFAELAVRHENLLLAVTLLLAGAKRLAISTEHRLQVLHRRHET